MYAKHTVEEVQKLIGGQEISIVKPLVPEQEQKLKKEAIMEKKLARNSEKQTTKSQNHLGKH